jgi:IPT/TIG domain/PASTA domain
MRHLRFLVLLALLVGCAFTSAAQAADITVGPDLSGTYKSESCHAICTLTNASLTQVGAQVTSPVSGVVVRWHVLEGATAGTYRLRAITPLAPSSFLFNGSSAVVSSVPSSGIQTFTVMMPIAAGQGIAIDMSETASIGTSELGSFEEWGPAIPAEGTAPTPVGGGELGIGFNAEVQPTPTISSLGATSGSTIGGTSVSIAGTDFAEVKSVSFGSNAASSYTVGSEGQITAISPAGPAGPVPISVTTIAGTATASQQFTYVAPAPAPAPTCTVPKLKGKSLKASKKKIKGADCKVGKVTKKKGAKAKTGKVVGQGKKPGTVLPAGTVIKVTLGKG